MPRVARPRRPCDHCAILCPCTPAVSVRSQHRCTSSNERKPLLASVGRHISRTCTGGPDRHWPAHHRWGCPGDCGERGGRVGQQPLGPPAGGPGLYPRAGRVDPGRLERQRAAPRRRLDRADLHGPGGACHPQHVWGRIISDLLGLDGRRAASGLRDAGGSLGLFLEALLSDVVVSHWVVIGALATLA